MATFTDLDSCRLRLSVLPRGAGYSIQAETNFGLRLELGYNAKSVNLKMLSPCCGYAMCEGATTRDGTTIKCGSCYKVAEETEGASLLSWQTPLYRSEPSLPDWSAWLSRHLPTEANPLERELLGSVLLSKLQFAHRAFRAYQTAEEQESLPYTIFALFPDHPVDLLSFPESTPSHRAGARAGELL